MCLALLCVISLNLLQSILVKLQDLHMYIYKVFYRVLEYFGIPVLNYM